MAAGQCESGMHRRPESLAGLFAALGGPDEAAAEQARGDLVALVTERVRSLAHRMLAGAPRVRRWEETDDVVQGALLRLDRALREIVPNDPQHMLRLAALQVRRELIDLSRRHGHAGALARNHETNALSDGNGSQRIEYAIDHTTEPADRVADWTRFHDLAAELPEEQRQLFEMVWYLGMSQDEIAAALECSTRTVRRRWEETKARFTETFRGRPPE